MAKSRSQREARRNGGILVAQSKEVGDIVYHLDAERIEKREAKQQEKTRALSLRKFSWEV